MKICRIPAGTKLFRGSKTPEIVPVGRFCGDTHKIGVYFSVKTDVIAKMMLVEHNKDERKYDVGYVTEYVLTKDLIMCDGKYGYKNKLQIEGIDEEDHRRILRYLMEHEEYHSIFNVSHYDDRTFPIICYHILWEGRMKGEVFLNEDDAVTIKHVDTKAYNVDELQQQFLHPPPTP